MTALLIAVVFTWFQDRDALRAQIGDSVLVSLLRYAIPAVLAGVTAIRLATRFDFPGWYELPGLSFVGTLPGAAITLGLLLVAYGVGRVLVRYRRRRRSRAGAR